MTHEELMRAHLEIETEGERTPAQHLDAVTARELDQAIEDSGIRRVEQFLEGGGMNRAVITLRPETWRQMSQLERRRMRDWCEGRIDQLQEKLRFMDRNMAPEPELPEALRARAGI